MFRAMYQGKNNCNRIGPSNIEIRNYAHFAPPREKMRSVSYAAPVRNVWYIIFKPLLPIIHVIGDLFSIYTFFVCFKMTVKYQQTGAMDSATKGISIHPTVCLTMRFPCKFLALAQMCDAAHKLETGKNGRCEKRLGLFEFASIGEGGNVSGIKCAVEVSPSLLFHYLSYNVFFAVLQD